MEPIVLRGERVCLRAHHIADVDAIVRQVSDPETQAWSGLPAPYSRAHALRYALKTAPAGWRAGNYLALAVVDSETDAFLGTVDVHLDGAGAGEIGYGFGPWARGRGIATEAVRLFLD
ncbi:MAG: GNAT family N-acetyltransferase, partial [bacterium]